jgi:hypothetical protein
MAEEQRPIRSIEDMYNARPNVDNSAAFEVLWETLIGLFNRLSQRFELHQHPSSKAWESYKSADGKFEGSLRTFSGPEVDWLVYSWTGQPKSSFCNMHLNVWLGPQYDVPHVSFVFGTVPELFAYTDFPPRKDLWSNAEYCDKYYEPYNKAALKWRADKRLNFFISESVYMRVCLSPNAICHVGAVDLGLMRELREEYFNRCDTFIKWVDEAKPLSPEATKENLERDRYIRREVANRDPVNALAEKFFGKDMTDRLIDALWGVQR